MGVLSILGRINLDGAPFHQTLKSSERAADKFAGKLRNQLGGGLFGFLGVRSLINIGKQAIESGHTITQLANKFNLTTDEVQLLQQEADRTGSSFESLVKDATKLEETLSRLSGGDVVFSRAQVEQLEKAHQIIKTFKDAAAVQGSRFAAEPEKGFGQIFAPFLPKQISNLFKNKLKFEGPNDLTNRQESQLEKEAKIARDKSAFDEQSKINAEKILKLQLEAADIVEKSRISQLSKEQKISDLLDKRNALNRKVGPLSPLEQAQFDVEIAKNEAAVAALRLTKDAVKSSPFQSDSLTSVGNFLGSNPNAPQVKELSKVNETLIRIERNTSRQGGTSFPL